MDQHRVEYLLQKLADRSLSDQEKTELQSFLEIPSNIELFSMVAEKMDVPPAAGYDEGMENILQKVLAFDRIDATPNIPSARIRFIRKWRWIAAAILVTALATATFIYFNRRAGIETIAINDTEILPGSNKAILTVGEQTLDLSENKTGIQVGKKITYNDGEPITEALKMVQLKTPKGGQYQVVLPDGSKAWLNAASSIRFPSVFGANQRMVEVTGEVFLEVAKNTHAPFIVNVNNTKLEVLGTSFNINSYDNENVIRTTLLEGSLRVNASVILKPGQQSVSTSANQMPDVIDAPDLDQVIAWKNGLFNFNNADVRTVMRQIERWYDIDIRYESNVPRTVFQGKIYRSAQLTEVLDMLKESGISFRIEGKTLTVI